MRAYTVPGGAPWSTARNTSVATESARIIERSLEVRLHRLGPVAVVAGPAQERLGRVADELERPVHDVHEGLAHLGGPVGGRVLLGGRLVLAGPVDRGDEATGGVVRELVGG